jgi:diadenosine tetraphosphate (Ap4A) HIT family hydrolase
MSPPKTGGVPQLLHHVNRWGGHRLEWDEVVNEVNRCELCDELAGGTRGVALWPRVAGSERGSRVVSENDAYVALVTIGPIARGHCLILPRAHRLSMSSDDERDRQLLTRLCRGLVSQMHAIYGRPALLFEHGAPEGSDRRPCTVAHAHWHVVPTTIMPEQLLMAEYSWQERTTPWVHAEREYLLVGDMRGRYWVTYPESPIPSQLLRRALAEHTGSLFAWDWRREPAVELALTTLRDFRTVGATTKDARRIRT